MTAGLLLKRPRTENRGPSGKRLRARIPEGVNLACKCQPDDCETARFESGVVRDALDRAFEDETLSAFHNNYERPLGAVSKGNIRRIGPTEIEIDIPIGTVGDGVLNAIEDAGIVVRPFIDTDKSTLEKVGTTAVYSVAAFRSLIVSSTDANDGWPNPELVDDSDRGIAANCKKIEHRYTAELRETEIGTLRATVIRYGERANIAGFTEEFLPGSLDHKDVVANLHHDRSKVIARTNGGGLNLLDSPESLSMELGFLPTQDAQDARTLARRGVLSGVSIEFRAIKDQWQGNHRTIEKAELSGLALVPRPAYQGSKIEAVRHEIRRPKRLLLRAS